MTIAGRRLTAFARRRRLSTRKPRVPGFSVDVCELRHESRPPLPRRERAPRGYPERVSNGRRTQRVPEAPSPLPSPITRCIGKSNGSPGEGTKVMRLENTLA